jgi:hypothetical protein
MKLSLLNNFKFSTRYSGYLQHNKCNTHTCTRTHAHTRARAHTHARTKLPPRLIKHAMNTYEGAEVRPHAFSTSATDRRHLPAQRPNLDFSGLPAGSLFTIPSYAGYRRQHKLNSVFETSCLNKHYIYYNTTICAPIHFIKFSEKIL